MMRETLLRWLYRWNWLKRYQRIDDLRYLKRLSSGKPSHAGAYVSEKDQAQFAADGEILLRFPFRDKHCRMFCRPDSHIEAGLLRDRRHAMRLQDIIADHLRDGVFVDVGANVGTFAIPLALAFEKALVVAFEPNPLARDRFVRNLAVNAIANVQLRAAGVGANAEELTLFAYSGSEIGQSSFLPPTGHHSDAPAELRVPVVTLDDALSDIGRRIEAIKIDVQGLEASVLEGGRSVIAAQRPPIVLEHEDVNFSAASTAAKARAALRDFFADLRYDVFYLSRKDANLMFPVRWESGLNGDLLAIPRQG